MKLNEMLRAAYHKPSARRLGLTVFVLLMVLVVAGWWLQPSAEAEGARAAAALPTISQSGPVPQYDAHGRRDSYADVVAQVAPAVVTIRSERQVRQTSFGDDDMDSLMQQFFGRRAMPRMPQRP